MNPLDEADFKVQTANMYANGGAENVVKCLIAMLEAQLIIAKAFQELLRKETK